MGVGLCLSRIKENDGFIMNKAVERDFSCRLVQYGYLINKILIKILQERLSQVKCVLKERNISVVFSMGIK